MIRDMKNFNLENFMDELNQEILKIPVNTLSGNDSWNYFQKAFTSILNTHAPFRPQSRKETKLHYKPWITKGILKSIRTKQSLFKKAVADKTTWLHFKKYRNTLTRVIQLAKQIHFKSKITQSKANPKILWKTVNDIVNLKQGKNNYNINIQTDSGHIEKNQEKVSNILNKHFTTVGTKLKQPHHHQTAHNIIPPHQ